MGSPRSISPLSVRRYGSDLDVPQGSRLREINRVVQMMHNQAMLDVRVEVAKGTISTGINLEDLFNELDTTQKGFVTDTDLWSCLQDVGAGTSLGSMTALVSEMQLRMGRDRTLSSGHMSMRELCILVFPANSVEFELALGSFSDNDLLFKLHLNRRVWDRAFPKLVRHQFHHLLDVAGSSAEQLEADRREFNLFPCDAFTSLNDTFNFIADGRASFSVMDLRRVFVNQGIAASSQEVEMLWRRFQPLPFHTGVRFSDFLRQLRPRFMALFNLWWSASQRFQQLVRELACVFCREVSLCLAPGRHMVSSASSHHLALVDQLSASSSIE